MGYQLCRLFVVILIYCAPVDLDRLWEASKNNLCDNLNHYLIHTLHIPEPTQYQVYDYGLHLIAQDLRRYGKNLQDYPSMPRPQGNWGHQEGNQLMLQTHINFSKFLLIFTDFLERLSHLAPIY